MLRSIAVVTLFAACALWGARSARRLSMRRDVLKEFCDAIRTLEIGVRHTVRPVAELLRCCGGKLTEPLLEETALRVESGMPTAEAFQEAAENSMYAAYLQERDKAIVQGYFVMLGAASRACGQDRAELLLEELSVRLSGAEEEYRKKGRIFRTMGLLTGAGIAILLI